MTLSSSLTLSRSRLDKPGRLAHSLREESAWNGIAKGCRLRQLDTLDKFSLFLGPDVVEEDVFRLQSACGYVLLHTHDQVLTVGFDQRLDAAATKVQEEVTEGGLGSRVKMNLWLLYDEGVSS